ncbi:unnamed protein product [Cunninghamella blakesleeana]
MKELMKLPTEIVTHICSFLNVKDLTNIRLVNKKLNRIIDQPLFWQHLYIPLPTSSFDLSNNHFLPLSKCQLWKLNDIKEIIEPHKKIIKSIKIYGVKDNIVKYILSQCNQLEELILYGWITLSNHAFQSSKTVKLHKLELIAIDGFPNLLSMNASLFDHLCVYSCTPY